MSKLIASLVPETLRRAYATASTPADGFAAFGEHGAILWCDVAKFSPLANRLVGLGATGVERLSTILNRHFDAVIETTLAFGGEPVEFFGDGVLIAFFCEKAELARSVRRAAACAQAIVDDCRREFEPGALLSLHLHVAAGSLRMLDFGGVGGERLFATVGDALTQLGEITRDQAPNQVILSAQAAALLDGTHRGAGLPNGGVLLTKAPTVALSRRAAAGVEAVEALTAFLPAPVRHGLDIGELRWTAELRTVTAVFLRLPRLEQASLEFIPQIHELARVVQTVTRRYEGVVRCLAVDDKGAGFQIVFGLPPLAHGDDSLRALRTAQELLPEFARYGQTCSVGLTAGVAFLGILGHDARRHYAVIGDAINIASRLSHASESSILCDEATMLACGARMSFKALAPVRVKGRAEPLEVWSPVALIRNATQTPIFGRDDALARTRLALDAAAAGRGATCLLVGEPGMGKSAVLEAAARDAEIRGMRVLIGESSRIEQATPFQALRAAFAQLFGLDAVASSEDRRTRLQDALDGAFSERLCLINAVIPLGIPESAWALSLMPAERVVATRSLLVDLLQAAAAVRPILLIVEDAHWADDETLLLLEQLTRTLKSAAILIGSRPPGHALGRLCDAGAQPIELEALDRAHSAALIASQLGANGVGPEVVELLFQRAQGNPFFTAELARYLSDRGDLVVSGDGQVVRTAGDALSASALPTSVRATITNRIDAMAPAPQLTLKVESVTGTRGPMAAVQHVHPLKANAASVAEHLQVQTRMGLVGRAVVDAVEGYEFRQEITREVVYELVLPEPRQRLHGELARWYEDHHANDLAAYFGRIAAHWAAAGDALRAAGYLEREAIRVFSNGHAQEATAIGFAALRLLGIDLPIDRAAVGARIGEGVGLIQQRTEGHAREALAQLPAMSDAYIARQVAVLLTVAPLAFQSNRMDLYALAATTALQLTLEHGNSPDAPQVYSLYSVVHGAVTGDRSGAWDWSRLALALDAQQERRLFAEVAFVYGWFHAHWRRPLSESLPLSLEAAEGGFASGALMFACFNLAAHVIYLHASGRPLETVIDAARRHLARNGGRVKNSAFHLIHELQTAKALAGLTREPLSFTDDEYDEERDLASILQTNLSNQIGYYLVSKVKMHCHYGDWDAALDWASRAQAARQAFAGQTAEFELVQYEALAAAGQALNDGHITCVRGAPLASEMRAWAGLCAENFEHKAWLLEGAMAGVERDFTSALRLLQAAAAAAETRGYLQDQALALEWKAIVLHRIERYADACASREQCAQIYTRWGAGAKAQWLRSLDGHSHRAAAAASG